MSLSSTKDQLTQLLAESDNKVIALSGKWGTGKSYMWDQVKTSSSDDKIKGALSASLFGLSSMEQVKMKLLQGAVPAIKANPGLWTGAKQAAKAGVKALEGFHRGFSALNELSLVFAPAMLRQRLIVLDDIERKHEKLNIDEILGFIDEFTQQHGTRFMLILNSDKLDKRDMWDTLREKVIDQEIRLTTSPSEAFDIALEQTPSKYSDRIRSTIESCQVTNIRIIRKVIKAVNCILDDRKDLTDAVLSRVIPSTVLLATVHYKGIEDGPDFDFVLNHGTGDWSVFETEKQRIEEITEDSNRKSRWRTLMDRLQILSCDDYELLVIEFLQSGLFDVSEVAKIIDRYVAESDVMDAQHAAHKFYERSLWEHTLTYEQLLNEAKEVASKASLLDAFALTSLCEAISGLPGGQAVADEALDLWIDAFKHKNTEGAGANALFHQKIHPRIQAAFDNADTLIQAKTSAYDVCAHIFKHGAWGTRQNMVMRSATVSDMEAIIRNSSVPDLRLFMVKMLDFCTQKEKNEKHFGSAMDNFIQACKIIVADPQSERLGKLLKILFVDSKLERMLEPSPPLASA